MKSRVEAGAPTKCKGGSWGVFHPVAVMLMLVDTLFNPAPLAKRASGPEHYFHSTKDRITTMEGKKGTKLSERERER